MLIGVGGGQTRRRQGVKVPHIGVGRGQCLDRQSLTQAANHGPRTNDMTKAARLPTRLVSTLGGTARGCRKTASDRSAFTIVPIGAARVPPTWGHSRPHSGSPFVSPNLGEPGGTCLAKLGQVRATLGVADGQHIVALWSFRFCNRPDPVPAHVPARVKIGQRRANIGQSWSNRSRSWPNFVQ